jgi:hypothetical protein
MKFKKRNEKKVKRNERRGSEKDLFRLDKKKDFFHGDFRIFSSFVNETGSHETVTQRQTIRDSAEHREHIDFLQYPVITINVPVLYMWRDLMKSTLENH